MSSTSDQKYSISAEALGPVAQLEGDLTGHGQNLIFARNGIGKSFLSRAFRYLDLSCQEKADERPATNLVSEESQTGRFSFSIGSNKLGEIYLEKATELCEANPHETIFHVFSQDFVIEELVETEFKPDGNIDGKILVSSESIAVDLANSALIEALEKEESANNALQKKFEFEKNEKLIKQAEINKQLNEYRNLSLENLMNNYPNKPVNEGVTSLADLLNNLVSLRSFPADPIFPNAEIEEVPSNDPDLDAISESLFKITSLSTVSDDIKIKIDANSEFFATGLQIFRSRDSEHCPFCEQEIKAPDPSAVIDAYIKYFDDEEGKHKSELREFYRKLKDKEVKLNDKRAEIMKQKSLYDEIKKHIPSKSDTEIRVEISAFDDALMAISNIKDAIEAKAKDLKNSHMLPSNNYLNSINKINELIVENNRLADDMISIAGKLKDERLQLQREACRAFEREFAIENWSEIENLKQLKEITKQNETLLKEARASTLSDSIKERVSKTFKIMLKRFFDEKYIFNEDEFCLKRGESYMERGVHRTLSEGEKTAIAFCYFIACTHKKVTHEEDYKNIFFVFDDPVTSLSYDYIFSIIEALKYLRISNVGEISINPAKLNAPRPKILILTHSSYFFNVAQVNGVINKGATFSLSVNEGVHTLSPMKNYIAPFEQLLEEIYKVANNDISPKYSTGNAIRSVLESIGRFCRPDKSNSLQDFISFLAEEMEGNFPNVALLNTLSHGPESETPAPDILRKACKETLSIVDYYAIGQHNLLKEPSSTEIV